MSEKSKPQKPFAAELYPDRRHAAATLALPGCSRKRTSRYWSTLTGSSIRCAHIPTAAGKISIASSGPGTRSSARRTPRTAPAPAVGTSTCATA